MDVTRQLSYYTQLNLTHIPHARKAKPRAAANPKNGVWAAATPAANRATPSAAAARAAAAAGEGAFGLLIILIGLKYVIKEDR